MGLFDKFMKKDDYTESLKFTGHDALVLALHRFITDASGVQWKLGEGYNTDNYFDYEAFIMSLILQKDFFYGKSEEFLEENSKAEYIAEEIDIKFTKNVKLKIDKVIDLVNENTNHDDKVSILINLIDIAMLDGKITSKEQKMIEQYIEAFQLEDHIVESIFNVISWKKRKFE